MDPYKETQSIVGVRPDDTNSLPEMLAPADSVSFRFRYQDHKGEAPTYIRAVAGVPGLVFGLNGNSQKVDR